MTWTMKTDFPSNDEIRSETNRKALEILIEDLEATRVSDGPLGIKRHLAVARLNELEAELKEAKKPS